MSAFHSFERSPFGAFVESPFHVRNARKPRCELFINAKQAINGFLPFDYEPGNDCEDNAVDVVYMTLEVFKEWNYPDSETLGMENCDVGPQWARDTKKIHRKFDDAGTHYYRTIETSCGGLSFSEILDDDGIWTRYWNPDIFTPGTNCIPGDGCVNGLDPDQDCWAWCVANPLPDPAYTDSHSQACLFFDAPAGRCGESGTTHSIVTGDLITQRITTVYDEDDNVTARITESLSDPWLKSEWYDMAESLLRKVSLGEQGRQFSILDTGLPRDVERFGCDAAADPPDINNITLEWRRGERALGQTDNFGVTVGGFPGDDAGQAAYLVLLDYHSASPDFFRTAIYAKKSRQLDPPCLVFMPIICDGIGGWSNPPELRECRHPGPLSGHIDILPQSGRNGETLVYADVCADVCV